MEKKLIHKHVHNYLLYNNIITCFQSGFTAEDSSVNQLVELYNTFCQALDEGKEVRAVFCDISKAFDRVWHRGLNAKMKHYGICGPLLNRLTNRFQEVLILAVFHVGLRYCLVYLKALFLVLYFLLCL